MAAYEVDMLAPGEKATMTPLEYWFARRVKLPELSRLAQWAAPIPATSLASEALFSQAGDIVSARRSSLTAENAQRLTFLWSNATEADVNQVSEQDLKRKVKPDDKWANTRFGLELRRAQINGSSLEG